MYVFQESEKYSFFYLNSKQMFMSTVVCLSSLYKGTRKYHVKALMAIQRVNQ